MSALPSARHLLLAALLGLASACGSHRDEVRSNAPARGAEAVVVGTVLDASTGEPLGGLRVRGPRGTSAVSARDGHFELRGLREGESGELVIELPGGATQRQLLRDLSPGSIEVVIHVRRR
jgi:hypothetical protein